MQNTYHAILSATYRLTHERLLKLADQLTDDQLGWRPSALAPTLGFHFWHVARWADQMRAALPGMTPELGRRLGVQTEVWEEEGLAAAWGWQELDLGIASTGMQMSDAAGAQLSFPPKVILLDYVERAFAAAEAAIDQLDDAVLLLDEEPQVLTADFFEVCSIAATVLDYLTHDNRHLGMIEGLLGILTDKGTATR